MSGGAAGQTSGEAGETAQCGVTPSPGVVPSLGIRFENDIIPFSPPSSVDGYVFVERVGSETLDLVDENGLPVSLDVVGANVDLERLTLGRRLWLKGYRFTEHGNPYDSHVTEYFALRTDESGPLLLAGISGMALNDDTLLGVPLSTESLCSAVTVLSSKSRTTGSACSETLELFQLAIEADVPVRLTPGTRETATLGGTPYDLTLSAAASTRISAGCEPSDWEPHLWLDFTLVTRNWAAQLED